MENFINFLIFLYVLRLIFRSIKKKDQGQDKQKEWKGTYKRSTPYDQSYNQRDMYKDYSRGSSYHNTKPSPLPYPPKEEDWLRGGLGLDIPPIDELGEASTKTNLLKEDRDYSLQTKKIKIINEDMNKDANYDNQEKESDDLSLFRQGIIMNEILQPPVCKRKKLYNRRY